MTGLAWRTALVACAAIPCGSCVRLRFHPDDLYQRPDDSVYECPQKERLRSAIESTLANLSLGFARVECPPVRFFKPPRTRGDLGTMLRDMGFHGVGVEVGVQQGNYTSALLAGWHQAALFVQVDVWDHQENYKDYANVDRKTHMKYKSDACKAGLSAKAGGLAGEVVQCQDFSTECAKLIPDGSLDFVYVDARHDRKGVLEDLQAYWPKVRAGGIIAGHDYMTQAEVGRQQHWDVNYDGTGDATGEAVRGAINDFFSGTFEGSPQDLKECPRQPVITYREMKWNTWIVAK
eukprot:CAMPEP_0171201752 /NCGR_PEP_ID=MMETSP0790-20130122/24649_1 /TAXON_ID=2925 /ORGANISM="Alexandrium catenella, Strain OF101" /LENGTH=290 /DNA_ID=CAMNT_0011667155 /DNA_START=52 /DNA_END=924 /DNA_ORIENTATION=-